MVLMQIEEVIIPMALEIIQAVHKDALRLLTRHQKIRHQEPHLLTEEQQRHRDLTILLTVTTATILEDHQEINPTPQVEIIVRDLVPDLALGQV